MVTATHKWKCLFHLGVAFSFRGLVHYCHGGKHGDIQVDTVPEKELRVLDLDLKAVRRRLSSALGRD